MRDVARCRAGRLRGDGPRPRSSAAAGTSCHVRGRAALIGPDGDMHPGLAHPWAYTKEGVHAPSASSRTSQHRAAPRDHHELRLRPDEVPRGDRPSGAGVPAQAQQPPEPLAGDSGDPQPEVTASSSTSIAAHASPTLSRCGPAQRSESCSKTGERNIADTSHREARPRLSGAAGAPRTSHQSAGRPLERYRSRAHGRTDTPGPRRAPFHSLVCADTHWSGTVRATDKPGAPATRKRPGAWHWRMEPPARPAR